LGDAGARRIDADFGGRVIPGLVASLTAMAAARLGLDPGWAVRFDFRHFSARSDFHVAANDARGLAWHLANTGYDVPMARLAASLGVAKQSVSRQVRRIEELRGDPATGAALADLEQVLGIGR
jgi:hypothetical protein